MIAFGCKREERKMNAKLSDSTDGCAPNCFLKYRYFSDFFLAAKSYQGEEALKSTRRASHFVLPQVQEFGSKIPPEGDENDGPKRIFFSRALRLPPQAHQSFF